MLSRDQYAVATTRHIGLDRSILIKNMRHQPCTARQRQELTLKADQPASRDAVFKSGTTIAIGLHILQLAATSSEFFHDRTLAVILKIHGQDLIGFTFDTIDLAIHDTRFTDSDLKALAAHILKQYGEMQLATA